MPISRPTESRPAETLLLEGPDATAFAHAQFSSKVTSLAVGQWQFSAWLDPQGRVRALFHLARLADDRYLMLLRGGEAAPIADGLRRFVFRSKLEVGACSPRTLATGPALPLHAIGGEAGAISLGCGTHSLLIVDTATGNDAWQLLQLRAGWPWLPPPALDALLPAALSLQHLQAVAVDKGCYPGQEIVARLHFRNGHKHHLHRVTLSQAVDAGSVLRDGGRDVGQALNVIATDEGIEALVVLNDALVAQAHDGRLNPIDNQLVIHLVTAWSA